jgi:hypothetical protein
VVLSGSPVSPTNKTDRHDITEKLKCLLYMINILKFARKYNSPGPTSKYSLFVDVMFRFIPYVTVVDNKIFLYNNLLLDCNLNVSLFIYLHLLTKFDVYWMSADQIT